MKDRIRELREGVRPLEPDAHRRREQLAGVVRYTEDYLDGLDERPVFRPATEETTLPGVLDFAEEPSELSDVVDIMRKRLDRSGTINSSGRFLAYIPSGALYESALGDFIASATNRYAGVNFAAPGVADLEHNLIRWLASIVGYPDSAAGDLTSGGSIAALSAMVTAREHGGVSGERIKNSVVYLTPQTHHCIVKAMRIAGLADCVFHTVAVDDGYRMRADDLAASIAADRKNGRQPWLILGTAGTTDTGAIDPMEDIADIARSEELWFHVDAAYGGAFVLCDEGRRRLRGIGRSDSLMLDPHKGFFLPFGSGAVLVRNGKHLHDAFRARGIYMRDLDNHQGDHVHSACDHSPELTRPARGLRLWLPLKLIGLAPFRAALEEKLLLARYFWERLSQVDGFRVGPKPDLSIVTFRYVPKTGDVDAFNQKLVDRLSADGRIFLSTTVIDGHLILRLAVLAVATHLDTIELAIDVLTSTARSIEYDG